MSLFFDTNWFDARLAERWLDRNALAACIGVDDSELQRIFNNERAPTAHELQGFANLLSSDLVEVTLRAGVASRADHDSGETTSATRIEDIEARLDAVDAWLEEFEASRKRA